MDDMTNDQMGPQPQNGPTQPPNPPAPPPQPQAAPAIPPSGSPAGAPAQATGTPAAPQPPPPPGSFFHNLSHSLIGAVLGHSLDAVAGKNVTTGYNTDDSGKQTPVVRPMTTGEKLKSIAARALQGLAAGAEVPQQKSGLAGALAGLGAGAKAEHQSDLQEDARKRQLSTDEFEREQKATLQKADILKSNALTMSTYYANKKAQNDMDPSFARHQSTYDAAMANPDFAKHTREMTDAEVTAAQKNDKNFSSTHLVTPLGWAPSTDADGNQLLNPDGSPQFHMRMGVIDGTQKGNWVIQPDEEKDIHEYGPMANIRGADNIKAGDTYPFEQYLALDNAVKEQKKNVLQGWQHSTIGMVEQNGTQVPVEINAADSTRTRPLPSGVTPMSVAKDEADIVEKKGAAAEALGKAAQARAEGNLANANATALQNAAGITNQLKNDPTLINAAHDAITNLKLPDGKDNTVGQAYLRTVAQADPGLVSTFLSAAIGDIDAKSLLRRTNAKAGNGFTPQFVFNALTAINPAYKEGIYDAKKKELVNLTSGPESANVKSFDAFLPHVAQAVADVAAFQTSGSPYANIAMNKLRDMAAGDPAIKKFLVDIEAPKSEYGYFLRGGQAASQEDQAKLDEMYTGTSTPNQILAAYSGMVPQAISRLDAIDQNFVRSFGVHAPNLITPEAKKATESIGFGDDVSQYDSGGNIMSMPQPGQNPPAGPQAGQTPQLPPGVPQGATHIYKDPANQNVVGYALNGKYVPLAPAPAAPAPAAGGNQ